MTYVIAEPCIDVMDKACIEECPVDCIYEGPRMLYIHPDECVDCGACEPVCPVEAIFYQDDLYRTNGRSTPRSTHCSSSASDHPEGRPRQDPSRAITQQFPSTHNRTNADAHPVVTHAVRSTVSYKL